MAATKTTGKDKGGKANGSKALVKWDEKFAGYAKEAKEQNKGISGGGIGVKFGRGSITVGGAAVPGGKLECIVLGSCALNKWYEDDYDPDTPVPPNCYAFAILTDDDTMAPHKDCEQPQADTCAECEKNKFGTAKRGRGKACANTVRLGVLVANDCDDADSAAAAELATGGVSPTNLKSWKKYVDYLADEHGRPPWAVVTEISSHDDPKNQIRLEFKFVELVEDDDVLEALEKRHLGIQDILQTPYQQATEQEEKPKKTGAGNSRKFAGGNGKKR